MMYNEELTEEERRALTKKLGEALRPSALTYKALKTYEESDDPEMRAEAVAALQAWAKNGDDAAWFIYTMLRFYAPDGEKFAIARMDDDAPLEFLSDYFAP